MNKKYQNPMKIIESHPAYKRISDEVDVLVRLSIEIYEARIAKKMTQIELAKKAQTTQKVISKIESGDVNIGLDLLQRLARSLDLKLQIGKMVLVKDNFSTQNIESAFKYPASWLTMNNNVDNFFEMTDFKKNKNTETISI